MTPRASDAARLYAVYFGFVGASGPYLPLLFDTWGFTALQIGALVAVSQLIRIFAPPLWGWAADRSGSIRPLLQASAAVMVTMCLLLPAAGKLDHALRFAAVVVVMIVLHLASAGQGPLTETTALRIAAGDFGRYGRMRVWGSVGFIATVISFGWLQDAIGIAWLPWLLAAICALLWFAAAQLPARATVTLAPTVGMTADDATAAAMTAGATASAGSASALAHSPAQALADPPPIPIRTALRSPTTVAFLAASSLMIMAHAPFYGFFSLYLAGLGFDKAAIGAFWAVGVGAEIVLFLCQKTLFDRFALTSMLLAAFVLAVLRFLMTAAAGSLAWWPAVLLLLVAQCLHAASFALHHSVSMALLRQCFGERLQARAQSLYTAVSYGVGGALGGLGAGIIWQTSGPGATFVAAAVVSAAGIIAAIVVRQGMQRSSR